MTDQPHGLARGLTNVVAAGYDCASCHVPSQTR
jgi:hypothetical protein